MPQRRKKEPCQMPTWLPENKKVAIVGIGCRFPGEINNVKDFWEVLLKGIDCTRPLPDDRFDVNHFYHPTPKTPGKLYVRGGGYLEQDLLSFDRLFFKMPPDEANHMDPQVRLLLEVVWEAFEDGGIPARSIRGTNCGVYMGVTASEYTTLTSARSDAISQYSNSGTNSCMVSNRISYEFDLHGPSLSIDTACSSSLYAVHLASEAIRNGDCDMAVAGGVNVIMMPEITIGFCQAGMLAPDGRSKSFDSSADGYCRSEGAGVIILKSLNKAVEDGDRIYAVIRGGALSNDGRTPGIANPSYSAQVNLVYRACRHAMINPQDIQYVEAHGTGTQVGDATEANALGKTIGQIKDAKTPLYIGSVKSNIGHCEGSSGIAGVIKVALMIHNELIPPVVHFKLGNPKIKFKELNIKVPKELIIWPYVEEMPLIAGCSSFGFGGANAHVILEAPPSTNDLLLPEHESGPQIKVVLISAATTTALSSRVDDFIELFRKIQDQEPERFYDVAATTCLRSHHHQHRLGVLGRDASEILHSLETFKTQKVAAGFVSGEAVDSNTQTPLVFVFNGMGTQWWGMGRQLVHQEPTFAKTIQNFDTCLKRCGAKWSMQWLLMNNQDEDLINQTEYAQPAICAVQIGLVEVLRKFGVRPDAVVGHSVGEVAAAYASGMLSFDSAVLIIYNRGKLLKKTSGSGKMLAVLHNTDAAQAKLNESKHSVYIDVAAINSPSQVVFSGSASSVDALAEMFNQEGIRAVQLKVNNAFHSYQQEPLKEKFLQKMKPLAKQEVVNAVQVPMISTVTNNYNHYADVNDGMYWWKNVRQQVKFQSAVDTLLDEGYSIFVEIGAHPALRGPIKDIIGARADKPVKVVVLETLKRPTASSPILEDLKNVVKTLTSLHCEGYPVQYEAMFPSAYKVMHLPLYPWERITCSGITDFVRREYLFPVHSHPLLGEMQEDVSMHNNDPPFQFHWKSKISRINTPWVSHHIIQGSVILPGTAYIETALEAVNAVRQKRETITLEDVELKRFLFPKNGEATIHTIFQENDPTTNIKICSGDQSDYIEHVSCKVVALEEDEFKTQEVDIVREAFTLPQGKLEHIQDSLELHYSSEEFYSNLAVGEIQLGSAFRAIQQASFNKSFTKCLIHTEAPDEIWKEFMLYNFHPAFLDCMMQSFAVLHLLRTNSPAFPSSLKRFTYYSKKTPKRVAVYIKMLSATDEDQNEVLAIDADSGIVCCRIDNLSFQSLEGEHSKDPMKVWSIFWVEAALPKQNEKKGEASPVFYLTSDNKEDLTVLQSSLKKLHRVVKILDLQDERKLNVDDIVLILISQNESHISGPTITTKEDVWKLIKSSSSFARDVILGILNLGDVLPKLWIITVKGFQVSEGDQVSPFTASTFAVGLSTLHEYPSARVYMVDISSLSDISTPETELMNLLCFPPFGENEFALRPKTAHSLQLFVRRTKFQSPLTRRHPIVSHQFRLHQNKAKQIKYVYEGDTITDVQPDNSFRISIEHFIADGYFDDDPHFICTGHVIQSKGSEANLQDGQTVIAVFKGCLKSETLIPQENVMPLGNFETSHAALLSLVNDAIASVIMVYSAKSVREDDRVLVCTCEESRKGLVTAQILKTLGCNVTILSYQCNNDCPDHEKLPCGQRISNFMEDEEVLQEDALQNIGKFNAVVATGQYLINKKGYFQCLDCLCDFGVFVVFTQTPLKLRNFNGIRENVQFLPISAGVKQLLKTPQYLAETLKFVDALSNKLCHLPTIGHALPASKIENKYLQECMGRVIHLDRPSMGMVSTFSEDTYKPNPEMTQCITGGAKGMGLKIVRWLIRRGSKHVVILTRSNPTTANQSVLDQLGKNADIKLYICDVSDASAVDVVFSEIVETQPPVENIFHCATVYLDNWMTNMSEKDWEAVMLPKAYGAVLLHQISLKYVLPLANFVMMSSLVALIGNAGQSNYATANSVLVSLVEMRRSMGLPATAVSFGVISEAGFAADNNLVSVWQEKGIGHISPSQTTAVLGTMLELQYSHLGVTGHFDEAVYARKHRSFITKGAVEGDVTLSRLQDLFSKKTLQELAVGKYSRSHQTESSIKEKLENYLSQTLGIVDISEDTSPVEMGLDSLMATELRAFIDNEFNVSIPPVDLLNSSTTVAQLVSTICKQLHSKGDNASTEVVKGSDQSKEAKTSFFITEKILENPKFQLFCFPPSGGGLTSFNGWQKYFSKFHTQVYVAQLPGWEGRRLEKPMKNMSEVIGILAREMRPLLKHGKFAFYGHSFGALLSFELAHFLNEQGVLPAHLFMGAWIAPQIPYKETPTFRNKILDGNMDNVNFVKEAQQLTFLDGKIINNPMILRQFVPVLRATHEMSKNYEYAPSAKLPCPLKIYGGKNDAFVAREKLTAWEDIRHKDFSFGIKMFNSGHLFLHDIHIRALLTKDIAKTLHFV
ncbi:compactin diketide synthase mokB [Lingula anatina]|uniref:Fatty acid synthase n=1 Tax=Lingula anatina TaxID=7574 RepID=A0A1S3IYY8_LINAN|nr:compactin diketide synthase mokB [Lingula anatina]XP_013403202.1 compactin diketide synthase mokB [Lingula anatina]|eukprot:XP_013403201.1 compactin diketide synthase mokB [Lingula anatina]